MLTESSQGTGTPFQACPGLHSQTLSSESLASCVWESLHQLVLSRKFSTTESLVLSKQTVMQV